MKIRLNLSSKEYTVSRAILVDQSQYVARVFGGNFTEVKDQPVVMKELDGVLFIQSFEIRLLWLSTGEVNCRNQEPGAKAATLIEFARLADVCDISQVEAQIAEHPRKSINQRITNNGSVNKKGDDESSINNENDPNASTQGFTTEDIRSVINLSIGHQVRSLVAKASVAGFLSKKDYRFAKLAQEVPVFGADLLVQVQATTRGVQYLNNTAIWQKVLEEPHHRSRYLLWNFNSVKILFRYPYRAVKSIIRRCNIPISKSSHSNKISFHTSPRHWVC